MFDFTFSDWGRWGVTDFFEDTEDTLRKAIKSGEYFDSGWHGCVKEFESARIRRDEDGITVSVYSDGLDDCMEQWDLFFDFLTKEEIEKLTDEIVEEIRDSLWLGDFVQEVTYDKLLPSGATFTEVVDAMNDLARRCAETLHESFMECIETTLFILYDRPDDWGFITERMRKYENEK